jgi:hypothetical protein
MGCVSGIPIQGQFFLASTPQNQETHMKNRTNVQAGINPYIASNG